MSQTAPADFLNTRPRFHAMLFTLFALAAVALPLLMQLPAAVAGVFAVCWLVRTGLLKAGVRSLASWQLLLLLAAVMLLVWRLLGTLFGLQGGIAFLLMLALLKSFEGKNRRDWQVLVLAMLFLTAGAVLFDQDLLVGVWVLVCLMLMAVSLALLNDTPWRAAWRQSALAFALTLPVMAVLFAAAPRRDAPLWGVPQNNGKKSGTGMSEVMKPGSIGELVQSNEPAFSATFDNGFMPQQQQLYWRVMLLSDYKNGAWHMALDEYNDQSLPSGSGKTVSYQIIAEDEKGRLPVLEHAEPVSQRGMWREVGGVLRVRSRLGVRRVRLQADLDGKLVQRELSRYEQRLYTSLPANTNPRTRALAQQLWQQSGGDTARFAQAAYRYFQKGFTYTLRPPVLSEQDSTDQFLFGSKQGFCEHYADAFTVLMRSAGVAARVVGGYQGGEYNEAGGFWQIRSKDAHAWTEIWLPETQTWQRIDPTAAVSAARIDGGLEQALSAGEAAPFGENRTWTRLLDRSRFYWQQWVINYDGDRQRNLLARLGLGNLPAVGVAGVAILALLAAMLPLFLWWRRAKRQDLRPLEDGFALLKRTLLPDADNEQLATLGPLELAQETDLPDSAHALLQSYIALHYGQHNAPTPRDARRWYAQVVKWARQQRRKAG
ncbi:DUF3488 and transglutaminase-like domain-containing protein [Conchiformibius steedae]|uniref:transglutaminase family protein n=1 Tax=Conchiformibius steedae TaxID=153493 RepID=UPI0026EA5E84|nr:DUF3488 and transglutaminase-like domain-containing protein [Conchiformibius steedae]